MGSGVPALFSQCLGRWDKPDNTGLVLDSVIASEEPFLHRPLPQSPCLALADPQQSRHIPHRMAILEQLSRLHQKRRPQITAGPCNSTATIIGDDRLRRRLEWLTELPCPVPELLEVNLESGALVRGVI